MNIDRYTSDGITIIHNDVDRYVFDGTTIL